jgi:hypothetical protein
MKIKDIATGLEEEVKAEKKAPKKKERKELLIRSTQPYAMYEVYYEGGGEVPVTLSGVYNSKLMAQKDIDMYLAQRKR